MEESKLIPQIILVFSTTLALTVMGAFFGGMIFSIPTEIGPDVMKKILNGAIAGGVIGFISGVVLAVKVEKKQLIMVSTVCVVFALFLMFALVGRMLFVLGSR